MASDIESRLDHVLAEIGDATVAVSGGVDSLTLAVAAHRRNPSGTYVFHAVSPAVPPKATERVQALAEREGWQLQSADAGEFQDKSYLANPANRCFFCKSNLYAAMRRLTAGPLLSGTNLDDLGDFRPGLEAARQNRVRHPYVEAGIGKADVRALARSLGLGDVAELPAQPCLSSRIETGITVDPATLTLVHRIETAVSGWLTEQGNRPQRVRCRVRRGGLVLELDPHSLQTMAAPDGAGIRGRLAKIAADGGHPTAPRLEPYRRGSAFLREADAGSAP